MNMESTSSIKETVRFTWLHKASIEPVHLKVLEHSFIKILLLHFANFEVFSYFGNYFIQIQK